jgi:hypothetical protein
LIVNDEVPVPAALVDVQVIVVIPKGKVEPEARPGVGDDTQFGPSPPWLVVGAA